MVVMAITPDIFERLRTTRPVMNLGCVVIRHQENVKETPDI